MSATSIAWTDVVWNPLVGCSRVSPGCQACYAERLAFRLAAMGQARYAGLTKKVGAETRWTGAVRLVTDALPLPLRWRKPRCIFVNSMSDLFHERVPAAWIDRIFEVMALAPQHTFQTLTKRPERMRKYVTAHSAWPLHNVHLGVSVENQAMADERIPLLLQTPTAVRWISAEPLLGSVDLRRFVGQGTAVDTKGLAWVVCGGESGPGARPCDLTWIRSIRDQCRAAGVPVFVKQLGAYPYDSDSHWITRGGDVVIPVDGGWTIRERSRQRQGADPAEWPEDLRVQEFPR